MDYQSIYTHIINNNYNYKMIKCTKSWWVMHLTKWWNTLSLQSPWVLRTSVTGSHSRKWKTASPQARDYVGTNPRNALTDKTGVLLKESERVLSLSFQNININFIPGWLKPGFFLCMYMHTQIYTHSMHVYF